MREGWKEVYLVDYYSISSGLSRPAEDFGSGFPFLSFKDVFHNYFVPTKLNELVESNGKEKVKYSIKKGDVFLTRTSEKVEELGLSSVALKDYPLATFNGFTKRLRPKKNNEVDPRFIGFYLRSPKFRAELTAYSTLTTRASLNNSIIKRLKINLPPLPTQRKIASILSSYDDLIENNSQRIKLLEEQAQLTYEEWFVRMKFPGHETAVFDEETGLPEGWEKVKLNEILKFNQGVQVPIDKQYRENTSERVRFIRIVDVTQGGQEKRFILRPTENQIVKRKDLFMVRYGAPQVVTNFEGAIANNFFKLNIIDNKKVFPKYVYSFLDRKEIQNYLMGVSVSATMPAISFKSFGQIKMNLPERNLQMKFHKSVDSIFEFILNLQNQNQHLKEARELLLPRLMMGVVEVDDLLADKNAYKMDDVELGKVAEDSNI